MEMQVCRKSDLFASSSQSENKRAGRNSRATSGRHGKKAKGVKGNQPGRKNDSSHAGIKRKADESRCFDCGKLGHFHGDSECEQPPYMTNKLHLRNDNTLNGVYEYKKSDRNSKNFRQGSSINHSEV